MLEELHALIARLNLSVYQRASTHARIPLSPLSCRNDDNDEKEDDEDDDNDDGSFISPPRKPGMEFVYIIGNNVSASRAHLLCQARHPRSTRHRFLLSSYSRRSQNYYKHAPSNKRTSVMSVDIVPDNLSASE